MKEDFDKAIALAIENKDIQLFGTISFEIANKYNTSHKTVHNRFVSIYGKPFRKYILEKLEPTKEQLVSIILNTNSSEEVRGVLGLPNRMFVGMYDRYFGVSTYQKAKLSILKTIPVKQRKSSLREDNIAILMSQHLGDGWYDSKRHALRITHGIKQAEYLRWKVALIHEGYNKTNTEIKVRHHKQGHDYVDYYSGKLGHVVFPVQKSEAVKLLTPLGWLLWYLDDGNYTQNITISIGDETIALAAQKELKTYDISSRIYKIKNKNAYNLILCGQQEDLKFYRTFIEPFINKIPNCMKYKCEMKI